MDTHALAAAAHVVGTRPTRCLAVVGLMLLAPAAAAHAQLTKTELFFELNNTDGDLGIHAALDGAGWRDLTIIDPGNRQMLDINVKGRLRKQGLTSAELREHRAALRGARPNRLFRTVSRGHVSDTDTLPDQ